MMTDNRQSGLSLLEVLVSVAIFAFGLLALAALMANGLRSNTSAMHRSFATNQVYDMADRMRANPDTDYDGIAGAAADPECISTVTGCSPARMLQYDQFEWNSDNANFLPGPGTGTVFKEDSTCGFENPNPCIYLITVTWDDDRDPATPDDSFVFAIRP
ncbi:MAG: type IV pilus modification protein PilV [Acidiferrobacteraceae bacterium]|jgi:type IV pilus assembly protein PilV|nr:type IV pilus modification protein PilV [Acidiferrobacteraceae bacterium]